MEGLFQFAGEDGQPTYFGPILSASDVERILTEKLNAEVVPAINALNENIGNLAEALEALKQTTGNVVEGTNSAIVDLSEKMETLLKSVDGNISSLKDKMEISGFCSQSRASSDSSPASIQNSLVSSEPYVTVSVGDEEYPYFMTHVVWSQISGSEIPRTIARVVLESLHPMQDLRIFTLTGKGLVSRDGDGNISTDARARKQLPPESIAIAQAVVVKTMRAGMLRKYEDKFNSDGFNPYQAKTEELKKSIRTDIRQILQSYRSDYDEFGQPKRSKKRVRGILKSTENSENEIPNDLDIHLAC